MLTWYAIYTSPRSEKKAFAELLSKGIDAYLPLQRILKQWSDRKKWVEEPLFRSYIFVNITKGQYFDVLNTPGIVRYITFEGRAVPIPPRQIDAIRYYLTEDVHDFPLSSDRGDWLPGTMVEITRGPLKGLTGYLANHQGRQKVRIEIEALGQSVFILIPVSQLKRLKIEG